MLALSPPGIREDGGGRMEEFPAGSACHHQFTDLGDGDLLDCIDFDDLFGEIEGDGELLPDLEMADPDTVAEFSAPSGGEESEMSVLEVLDGVENGGSTNESGKVDPAVSKGADEGGEGGGKSSVHSKNSRPQGKRKVKVKVDWTPELHRRFVQAVEQLGLDKAVPSKILEIMGIDCLTRHNIASHLQKYRSQRKHLLAREAEEASWNHQRRQMHIGGMAEPSPWLINGPAMGFPPPMAPRPVQPPFRPLHVWGHPSADQPAWHSHAVHLLPPSPPPRPVWSPVYPPYNSLPPPLAPPPMDHNTYWNIHHHQFTVQLVPNAVTPGTPYFPQPLAVTGFMSVRPVPGILPSAMHRVDPGIGVPAGQPGPQPPPEFHRSRDPIDAAMGDILTKPWQPLPVGLKPPSLDGMLAELHRQGIPNIQPSSLC